MVTYAQEISVSKYKININSFDYVLLSAISLSEQNYDPVLVLQKKYIRVFWPRKPEIRHFAGSVFFAVSCGFFRVPSVVFSE